MKERVNAKGEKELLKLFSRDIENISLLKHEEELALTKKAFTGDMESRNRLVEANLRFVIMIAFRYWRPGFSFMDIISEGYIGLINAIEKYNPDLGFKLTAYAGPAIKHCIINFIVKNRLHEHISLDEPLSTDDDDVTLKDLLISEETYADQKCFYEDIRSLVDQLSDREKGIIMQRFWNDKTLEEVGLMFNLSKERIRGIEVKALRKLRWSIYKQYNNYETNNDIKTDYALSR